MDVLTGGDQADTLVIFARGAGGFESSCGPVTFPAWQPNVDRGPLFEGHVYCGYIISGKKEMKIGNIPKEKMKAQLTVVLWGMEFLHLFFSVCNPSDNKYFSFEKKFTPKKPKMYSSQSIELLHAICRL